MSQGNYHFALVPLLLEVLNGAPMINYSGVLACLPLEVVEETLMERE